MKFSGNDNNRCILNQDNASNNVTLTNFETIENENSISTDVETSYDILDSQNVNEVGFNSYSNNVNWDVGTETGDNGREDNINGNDSFNDRRSSDNDDNGSENDDSSCDSDDSSSDSDDSSNASDEDSSNDDENENDDRRSENNDPENQNNNNINRDNCAGGNEPEENDEIPLFDVNYLNERIWDNYDWTIRELVLMIESYSCRHSMTKVAMSDLIRMLNIILRGGRFPRSLITLDNIFKNVFAECWYHLCCLFCGNYLVRIKKMKWVKVLYNAVYVIKAESRILERHYFITYDIKYLLKNFLSDPKISEALVNNEINRFTDNGNVLKDLYDAVRYKKLKQPGEILNNPDNFSIDFNVDGASFFKSSNQSC